MPTILCVQPCSRISGSSFYKSLTGWLFEFWKYLLSEIWVVKSYTDFTRTRSQVYETCANCKYM